MMQAIKKYSGAVIYRPSGLIFLQLRDANPSISNPGKVSLFGGGALPGETPFTALQRELNEELGLSIVETDTLYLGLFRQSYQRGITDCSVFAVEDVGDKVDVAMEGMLLTFTSIDAASSDARRHKLCSWALKRFRAVASDRGLISNVSPPKG